MVTLRQHDHFAGQLTPALPGTQKILIGAQPALAMPAAHVYRDVRLAGGAPTIGWTGHLSLRVIGIIWQT
jgi:hypothetical protein